MYKIMFEDKLIKDGFSSIDDAEEYCAFLWQISHASYQIIPYCQFCGSKNIWIDCDEPSHLSFHYCKDCGERV